MFGDARKYGGLCHVTREKASEEKRRRKAVPVLSAVGLSLSLGGSGSGAPAVDVPPRNTSLSHEIILAEEEISDVTFATFYVFCRNISTGCAACQRRLWWRLRL
jgi:hypothetical protein